MAVDASLLNPGAALNAKPIGYIDPIASQAKVMQLKSAGQAQKLQDQQILQNQTAMDLQAKRQQAFQSAVRIGEDGTPNIDYPTIFKNMAAYGDPELPKFYESWQSQEAAKVKNAREAKAADYTIAEKARVVGANIAAQARPDVPETHVRVIAEFMNDPDLRPLLPPNPEQVMRDPVALEKWQRSLMSAQQQEGIQARETSAADRKAQAELARQDRLAMRAAIAQGRSDAEAVADRKFHQNNLVQAQGRFGTQFKKVGDAVMAAAPVISTLDNIDEKTGLWKGANAKDAAALDNNLRINYAKLIDPGATVQGNDFANQLAGLGFKDEAIVAINRFMQGGSLPPNFRRIMAASMKKLYGGFTAEIEENRESAKQQLREAGYDLQSFGMLDSMYNTTKAAKAGSEIKVSGAEIGEFLMNNPGVNEETARKVLTARKEKANGR